MGIIAADKKKTIGVLTSGGDAPGMNAAIRAVVRSADNAGYTVYGVRKGFSGLLEQNIVELHTKSVAEILNRGGTMLYSARCVEFLKEDAQRRAAKTVKDYGMDALVVIGGDGSYRGAYALAVQGVNVMCIPGTIDLDIGCTEYTIGFDTAINTAMVAIDRIRDTSASHNRCSVVEVMGRSAGHIAMWCGIAGGAEAILRPEEYDGDEQKVIDRILYYHERGKKHHIVINAEGVGDSAGLASRIEKATGIVTRATVLGYVQRGGNPSCRDRVYASAMGAMAVDLIANDKQNRVISWRGGAFVDDDIKDALSMGKRQDEDLAGLSRRLVRDRDVGEVAYGC